MEISVGRYLPHPGRGPAIRDVRLTAGPHGVAVTEGAPPDADGRLAMPAPVNAHDHGYGIRTLDFGCPDDALEPWIAGLRLRPPTDPYLEALVAFGRLALNGCGATMHCHNSLRIDGLADEAAMVIRAARDCGIRLALSCPLLDTAPWTYAGADALRAHVGKDDWQAFEKRRPAYASIEEQIAVVSDIVRTQSGPMVDVQFGPIGPQWCSDALLEAIAETSRTLDCRIHMHLLETRRQRHWLDKRFPDGIVRYLDSIGFLSPRLAVAHGVHLTPGECELLAERGVVVASNPAANLRLRSGVAPVSAYRSAGLRFALGLDGTGFSDDQDIWQEMRLLRLLQGGTSIDPAIQAGEIFDAATINGAAVINQRTDGDLVVIDYGAMMSERMFDDVDEAEAILTRMSGRYVKDLVISGKTVVADGRLTGFDFEAALKELVGQARASAPEKQEERQFARRLGEAVRRFYRDGGP
ncbi:amidohydrolase family protein [Roseibium marinum]|uniref:Cytosine/adenosine deaminase-related metal-dependent hydrolase n=1 Tax=Roseibium marinum TaxID=281252 RepID=A0A2S3UXZ4_9HYPH|nr:amidohydrolase family protein [Roseibium marinum]POF32393.1 cytosine/adenosine deaminase-related metal-dependent hydrolase [Roseibium marinum]